ncbi:hypothetical protein Dimus_033841, partial [Dionaea muscipula]
MGFLLLLLLQVVAIEREAIWMLPPLPLSPAFFFRVSSFACGFGRRGGKERTEVNVGVTVEDDDEDDELMMRVCETGEVRGGVS